MTKERYCRYCGKKLDSLHYFFCNNDCMEKFANCYTSLEDIDAAQEIISTWTDDIDAFTKKNKVLPKCEECKNDCKIKVSQEDLDTLISFECLNFIRKEN